jgi:lysophospholipase L1-like esterase
MIENFTLLRFPERKVHFVNAGWGGDTAAGGLARLERDVFGRGATLVTVAYGINDIGWGGKADDEHRQKYLDGVRGIVDACRKRNVRVFICSAAATHSDPAKSADDFLQQMCDDGMKLARDAGEGSIDVLREMRAIQRRMKAADPKETLHVADGIHLNDLGQTAMAYAILKGLHAPADVSSATIDAAAAKSLAASGCTISNVTGDAGQIEFDRLDQRLPFNQHAFFALRFRFIPIPEDLNRYMLAVKNLGPGKYDLKVSGRAVGTFTADDLARGVNLSSATADGWEPGGPWEAQAWLLNHLTESRNEAVTVDKLERLYLQANTNRADILKRVAAINAHIEDTQRALARPVAYHFAVARAASP